MSRSQRSRKGPGSATSSELIGGRHAVLEALRRGRVLRLYMASGQKGAFIEAIVALAGQKDVPLEELARSDFEKLAGHIGGNQGVAATVPPFAYRPLAELIALTRSSPGEPFLLMLDHVEDPHNLGAVMRTADAAGVHGLIIPNQRAAAVTPAVRKVAAGAAERLPVALVGNLSRAAESLKQEGFWLYGAEAGGESEFYRADFNRPLVLVIGSEGRGLSRLLRDNCDLTLNIPMPGASAGSLNLSAAAAVLIYAALTQRMGWSS